MKRIGETLLIIAAVLLSVTSFAGIFDEREAEQAYAKERTEAAKAEASLKARLQGTFYTACNLWYERPDALWSVGYKVGSLIPVGTEVTDLEITGGGAYFSPSQVGAGVKTRIRFTRVNGGGKFVINIAYGSHENKTPVDILDQLFERKRFVPDSSFTQTEIDAISSGILTPGLRKKAVLRAWGQPPENLTPTLNSNVWTYALNKFRVKSIHFDQAGLTVKPDKNDKL